MRRFIKILKITLKFLIGFFLLIFILLALDRNATKIILSPEQVAKMKSVKAFDNKTDSATYQILLEKYGTNKVLPKGYELQTLYALSFYPELTDVPIEFIIEEAFIPLSSRPDPLTVLFPWLKRKYIVSISKKTVDYLEPILLTLLQKTIMAENYYYYFLNLYFFPFSFFQMMIKKSFKNH